MRVAVVGNMNNASFALVRFLRDRGVEAELLLTDNQLVHFRPECDTYDDGWQDYVRELGWGGRRSDLLRPRAELRRGLATYDVLVGEGLFPAYAYRMGRRLAVFKPHGSDLYAMPFQRTTLMPPRSLIEAFFRRAQCKGIRAADHIFCKLDFFPPYRESLEALGVGWDTVMGLPIYYPEYDRLVAGELTPRLEYRSAFERVRDQHDFLVYGPSRQYWRSSDASQGLGAAEVGKGNDVLFKGFARYVQEGGGTEAGLIVFEYGPDVAESKRLCAALGIERHVHWFPLMPRREMMWALVHSDVGADQFPSRAQVGAFGGATLEMMVMRKPVLGTLHLSEKEWEERVSFTRPPIVSVASDAALANALARLAEDPDSRAALGERSRGWVLREYGDSAIDAFVRAIEAAT